MCLKSSGRGWPLGRPNGWPSYGPVTPLFLNLLDAEPAAADQLEPLQLVMATVQPILQRYEGSLKQVVVDDKGLTLIAVFGLPPLAHEDDPARATQAALVAQAALGELGVRCAIGLATGRAFCGAVGSDVHREYDVIGEVMNLAARLMQAAPGGSCATRRPIGRPSRACGSRPYRRFRSRAWQRRSPCSGRSSHPARPTIRGRCSDASMNAPNLPSVFGRSSRAPAGWW